jgi:hypothetical protein
MANFYVNSAADAGGNGTTSALTGANCAWDTIADVNAASFSAGDSILFARGCTWRERLLVPSSGSAGSPITLGAYGTGANPIIDGSDIIGTWGAFTEKTALEDQTGSTYNRVDMTTDKSFFWSSVDLSAYAGTDAGNTPYSVILTDAAGKTAQGFIGAAGAGPAGGTLVDDVAGWDLTSGWTLVSGSETIIDNNSFSTTAGGQGLKKTDETIVNAALYNIVYSVSSTGGFCYRFRNHAGTAYPSSTCLASASYATNPFTTGTTSFFRHASAGTTDITSISVNRVTDPPTTGVHIVSALGGGTRAWTNIDAGFNPNTITTWKVYSSMVWSATVTTQPYAVWFNGTLGQFKASLATLTSVRDWFWASNVLYCYSLTDPDTAYAAPGVESCARTNCIDITSKDYIALENLTLQKSGNDSTILECVLKLSHCTGITLTNCNFWDSTTKLVRKFGSTGTLTVDGCSFRRSGLNRLGFINNTALDLYGGDDENGVYLVQNCTFQDIDSYAGANHYGNGVYVGDGAATIRYNIFYGDDSNDAAFGVHLSSPTTCTICYNLFTVRNSNGVQTNRYGGVGVRGTTTGRHLIYNNVFNGCRYGVLSTIEDPIYTAKNNIFYSPSGTTFSSFIYAVTGSAVLVADNNCFYSEAGTPSWTFGANTYTTFANWKTGSSQDAASLYADPLLTSHSTSDFRLTSTSPCINAGVDVGLTTDYAGNTVPSGGTPDIGAYEFQLGLGGGNVGFSDPTMSWIL